MKLNQLLRIHLYQLLHLLNEAKIESRIKKLVANCNALIKQAIDKDGDPIPVEDPSSTWASQYVYDKIVFKLIKFKENFNYDTTYY